MASPLAALRAAIAAAGNAKTAASKTMYFKNVCRFAGVKTPQVEAIHRDISLPALAAQCGAWPLADQLLREDTHELKQLGCLALYKCVGSLGGVQAADTLTRVGALIQEGHVRDWATSDAISMRVLSRLLREKPLQPAVPATLLQWAQSTDCLWKRRAAVVAFIKSGAPACAGGLQSEALAVCNAALTGPLGQERFVQLGVGWTMRELGTHDAATALELLRSRYSDISREGLRYALEKTPAAVRAAVMAARWDDPEVAAVLARAGSGEAEAEEATGGAGGRSRRAVKRKRTAKNGAESGGRKTKCSA
jgi:3-methyladenine DNA glycosylase AlkD